MTEGTESREPGSGWAPVVLEELRRHGLEPAPGDRPEDLRVRLSALYLDAIRHLKGRLRAGDFPVEEYRHRVQSLKEDHPLLGVPLERWREAAADGRPRSS